MSIVYSFNTSRLRGIDQAAAAVRKGSPVGMALLARSMAHEIVDACEIPQIEDRQALCAIADAWIKGVTQELVHPVVGDAQLAGITMAIDQIVKVSGLDPVSGLRALGFESWDEAVRSVLGLEEGEFEQGVDLLADMLERDAEGQLPTRALECVPRSATVELSSVAFWNGRSLDGLVEECGLRFNDRRSGMDTVECDHRFARMLRYFNLSLPEVIEAVRVERPNEFAAFTKNLEKMHAGQRSLLQKRLLNEPTLMSAKELVEVVENSSQYGVPNLSFQIKLRDLMACDPSKPILLLSKENKYHVGCHDGIVNGAGYMDTFKASDVVAIKMGQDMLMSEARWNYTLSRVYWHVESAYAVRPAQAAREAEDQLDVIRILERVGRE